ncbi:SDR family oxidoreductase [Bacteroidia bacterium]|jgi:NADP-dependent 3-hydroxy acid dehydrogenase YdfG|nr:SDR family oxidoreductase [Bacteroidia bacterium]
MDLKGKYVVITGVSRGIGNALVYQFLAKGCLVGGMGLTDPKLDHPNFSFYKTDVRKSENVQNSFRAFLGESNNQLDILVNNSGLGYFGKIEDYTDEQIAQMFETNVYGTLYTCREAVPVMKSQQSGHIINIASTAALEGYPEVSVYCATKHAVKAISESMYKELRDYAVKVTCVYPGSVKTDFFRNVESIEPHDYMLMPEDVATMIVQSTEMPANFHQVNLEVRPLQPKGPKR